jgi:hypothetical protein
MDWDEKYQRGDSPWDKGAPSPPMKQYLERHAVRGRALVPGCGRGHEVALAAEHGLDATGLDIAPTAVAEAQEKYPQLADRFVTGSLFDPPQDFYSAFDVVLEHTCLCALPPSLRPKYRQGIDLTLRRGGLLIGVWYINPNLGPGEEGPPYPFSVQPSSHTSRLLPSPLGGSRVRETPSSYTAKGSGEGLRSHLSRNDSLLSANAFVLDLTTLFADGYEIVDDYIPDVAFAGREGRERVRVLRRADDPN